VQTTDPNYTQSKRSFRYYNDSSISVVKSKLLRTGSTSFSVWLCRALYNIIYIFLKIQILNSTTSKHIHYITEKLHFETGNLKLNCNGL